ncbi:DNA-directed RNA polymerase subunit B'' [Candidatus Marsarchaeota archaeon]|nr:DNA-directed RNA polymerase subunit B'' [Candidatus Marsarchaeota archaeon]MCL5404699.1 DNA-directed RNA polymerase subunit B'' [Candidatus Marsarchaeota archaeon]
MSETHEVMESYLKSTSISQQQIDSYNRFISVGINKIIESQSLIEPEVSDFAIKLGQMRLEQPIIIESDSSTKRIMPNEAVARNLTYAAPMYLTYVPVISGIEKADAIGEAYVGELPVMVKSNLCYTRNMSAEQLIKEGEDPDDPGGYFIIKGTERVLVGIEDLAPNRMITTSEKSGIVVKVFSTTVNFRARCSITRDDYGIYTILFPTLNKGLSLMMILRALGISSKEILSLVDDQEVKNDLMLNMELSKGIIEMQPKEAMIELGRMTAPNQAMVYQEKRAETQLDTYILPHLGTDPSARLKKAEYLVRMAERTSLVAEGKVKADDKDHYANKRVKLAGDLMDELFNTAFKAFVKDIKYHVERTMARGRRLTVKTNINPDTLTEKILYSMSTGSWPAGQTGVSQVLDRINYMSSVAHLRRIKSPLAKKHPHLKARDVHGTHVGKICPSESPEGTEVGLTRYLALMAKVTVGAEQSMIEKKIKELKLL